MHFFDEEDEPRQQSNFLVEKSHSNIHQTINPTVKYTAMQAKVLHAVQFMLQQTMVKENVSPQEFHRNHKGNLEVTIKSPDFRRLIDCESRNSDYIRKIMNELRNLSATWDTLSTDTKQGKIGFHNLFIAAEYTSSHFKFLLPNHTVKLLVSDEKSAVIDVLTVAQSLDSKYAVFLNDLLEEHSYKTSSDDFMISLTDDELRNLMKIPFKEKDKVKVYSYPQPAALVRTVLKPATTQINAANLRFEVVDYNYVKKDGVLYWSFSVASKKTKLLHNFAVLHALELDGIRKALKEFGVSASAITKISNSISSEKELDYVQFNIEIVKEKIKEKTVKTTPARLFMSCHEKNRDAHDSKWLDHKRQKEIENSIRRAQYDAQIKKEREALTAEFIEQKVENFVKALLDGHEDRTAVTSDFLEYLSNIPTKTSTSLQQAISKKGMTDDIIKDAFFTKYLKGVLASTVTEEEIENYLEQVGTSIHI
ncbi:hypothetical protein [Rheinheimera sp.]|uniref:hypothetical protein n=1 Tax=Rheinheimera sp. TaxID=1869214 RepID=UPI004047ADB0